MYLHSLLDLTQTKINIFIRKYLQSIFASSYFPEFLIASKKTSKTVRNHVKLINGSEITWGRGSCTRIP